METTATTIKKISGSIWRLSRLMEQINEELIENGGEVTEEMAAAMRQAGLSAGDIVEAVQQITAKNKAEDVALGEEIKRLQGLKKARANAIAGLRRYLLTYMVENNVKVLEGRFARARVCAGRETIRYNEDELLVPYNVALTKWKQDEGAALPDWVTVSLGVDRSALTATVQATGILPEGVELARDPYVLIK